MDIGIVVNKKEVRTQPDRLVGDLLADLGYAPGRSAVWVDGRQLLKAEYGTARVAEGQHITIRRIVAGG